MLKLISGSELAKKRREEIKEEVIKLKEKVIMFVLLFINSKKES